MVKAVFSHNARFSNMRNPLLTCGASNTSSKQTKPSKNTEAHKALWTQTSNTQTSQQHKTNMESHRSLKRTLLQAEIQRNS